MSVALLEHAEAIADKRGMPKPEGLIWTLKTVAADLSSYGGYRWPFPGNWAQCSKLRPDNTGPCPSVEGDGLCLAKTWRGMASGAKPAYTLLLVGYREEDVLGEDEHKLRVGQAYVRDVISGVHLVCEHGQNADLSGADLSGADLSRADLSRADLSRAHLYGANLYRANLCGADLSGADLYGANLSRADLSRADLSRANLREAIHNKYTKWPDGFEPPRKGA